MKRRACATLLWLASMTGGAQEPEPARAEELMSAPAVDASAEPVEETAAPPATLWPVISGIDFRGNDVTRPETLLREMVIKVGDAADPVAIERSRQGIQDLGLFRSVQVESTPAAPGVQLTFVVQEKWYFIPIPRFDANSEGESAYGASLRWYNVGGRNHTLRANYIKRDHELADRGESTNYSGSYSMPFLFDSPYTLGFGISQSETPFTTLGGYVRTHSSVAMNLQRSFSDGPASTGWTGGVSLDLSRETIDGPPGAPEPAGHATAPGLTVGYRDMRDLIYSNEGVVFSAELSGASESLASEYSYVSATAAVSRAFLVGGGPHRNWNVRARTGTFHGGSIRESDGVNDGAFSLGGTSALRAYPSSFVSGDFFYHLTTEFLHPVGADWLRALVILETGNAFDDANAITNDVYSSIGLGLRVRINFLVDVDVEAGFAWQLEDGDRRFFASKV